MTDPSLHRTNINLYTADVEWLRARYGFGWTERVREIVRAHIHATEAWKELTDSEDVLEDETHAQ